MIIAIKDVKSIYARAELLKLRCPAIEISSREPYCRTVHDWVISAPEEYQLVWNDEDESYGEVEITIKYHKEVSRVTLKVRDFDYIVTYRGDLFTEKREEE